MTRLAAFVLMTFCAGSACAQVAPKEDTLAEQFVPESFRLEASAVAAYSDQSWRTSVNWTMTNNSGIGLYMGIALGSASIGSCNDLREVRGGLPVMRGPGGGVFVGPYGSAPSQPTFVPAGGRIGGSLMFIDCQAPNPGMPTAQLSMSLLLGRTQGRPSLTYPVAVDAAVRQIRSQ